MFAIQNELDRLNKLYKDLDQAEADAKLWEWLIGDMSCTVAANSALNSPNGFVALDCDYEVIAEGVTAIDAARNAEKRILESEGHEPI